MTTVEAAVLAPVIMVLLLFIVFLGRITTMQQAVQRSARDSARAASQAITRDEAATAIDTVLDDSLGANRRHCTVAPTDLTAIGEDTGAEGDWDLGLIQVRIRCSIPTSRASSTTWRTC